MALVGSCRRLRTPIWAFSRSYEGEFGVPAGGKWPVPLISVRVPDVLRLGGQVRHNRIPPPGLARPERAAIRYSYLPTRGMCCHAGSPFRLLLVVRPCLTGQIEPPRDGGRRDCGHRPCSCFREQHTVVSIAVEWLFRASVNRYCGASADYLVAFAQ